MSDILYSTGIVISAETLTGITGAKTFSGSDVQGAYTYNKKLNALAGSRVELLAAEQSQYDYSVISGIPIRDDWVSDIQTEYYWNNVAVDTEIEVSTDNSNWIKKHFAEYDNTSPDGKYFYVWVEGRTQWTNIGGAEVFEVTMIAASTLNDKYFLIHSLTDTTYYVWFNVDSGGTDPSGAGQPLAGLGYTGVEVTLYGADSSALVATKAKVVINGLSEFLAIISPENSSVVAVAPSAAGDVYDAQPGNSSLTIEVKVQGGDKESYAYARIV